MYGRKRFETDITSINQVDNSHQCRLKGSCSNPYVRFKHLQGFAVGPIRA